MSAFKLAFYIVIAFFIIFFLMLIFFENFTMGVIEVIGGLVELIWALLCLLFLGWAFGVGGCSNDCLL